MLVQPGKLLDLVVQAFDASSKELFEKTIVLRTKLMDVVSHSLLVFVLDEYKQEVTRMVDWTVTELCRLDLPCSPEVGNLVAATCKVATRLLNYDVCFLARRSASDILALLNMTDQSQVLYDVSVAVRHLYKHSTPAWNHSFCASDPKLGAMVLACVGTICAYTNIEAVKSSCMAVLEQVLTVLHSRTNSASNSASNSATNFNQVAELVLCTSHNTTVVAAAFRFASYYDACTAMDFLIKLSKFATNTMWQQLSQQARQNGATWVLLKRLARRNSSKTWTLIKQFAKNNFWNAAFDDATNIKTITTNITTSIKTNIKAKITTNIKTSNKKINQTSIKVGDTPTKPTLHAQLGAPHASNASTCTEVGGHTKMPEDKSEEMPEEMSEVDALVCVMKSKLVVSIHPTPSEWSVVSHASSVLLCVSPEVLEKDAKSLLATAVKTLVTSRQTTAKTFDQNLCLVVLINKLLGLLASCSETKATVKHIAEWLVRNQTTCMTFAMSATFCDLAVAVKAFGDGLSAHTIACLVNCLEYRATNYTTSPNPALLALAFFKASTISSATLPTSSSSTLSQTTSFSSSTFPTIPSLATLPNCVHHGANPRAAKQHALPAKPLKRKHGMRV